MKKLYISKRANELEDYEALRKLLAYQKATAMRGLITSIKEYAKYELNDILEALEFLPDPDPDFVALVKTRISNVFRKLDDEFNSISEDKEE